MFEFLVFCIIVMILWALRRATRIFVKDSRKLIEMNAVQWHNSLDLMNDDELDRQINDILNPSTPKKGK